MTKQYLCHPFQVLFIIFISILLFILFPAQRATKRLGRMQGTSKSSTKPHFVIQFLEAIDCPSAIDYRQKSNLYIRSLVWQYTTKEGKGGAPPVCKPECISEIVTTHIRLDCRAAVWNSYRDFRVSPPDDAVLLVQIYHATTDSPKPELDILLGKVEIPLSLLRTEEQLTQRMIPIRVLFSGRFCSPMD